MSHVALVRSAIADLIAAVPEVGRVHAYQRFASREAEMKALYVATIAGADQLRGWFVTRTATRGRAGSRAFSSAKPASGRYRGDFG